MTTKEIRSLINKNKTDIKNIILQEKQLSSQKRKT